MAKRKIEVVETTTNEEQSAVAAMGRAMMGTVETVETPKPRFAALAESLQNKRAAYETAKARVTEAREAESAAVPSRKAVEETCNAAIAALFAGMESGALSKDEASAILGDTFGYNPKADGTPGKTPAGTGNSIRKRAVLLSEAAAIVKGDISPDKLPKWSEGKSVEYIAPYLNEMKAGSMTPTSAYEKLAKREVAKSPDLPFNEKRLLDILAALHNDADVLKIAENPALVAAYDAIAARWVAISG